MLDREFLGIRCRLIELAAALDRIDRAADAVADDARRLQIRRSLEILWPTRRIVRNGCKWSFRCRRKQGLGIRGELATRRQWIVVANP